jgi:hypothetical protein
LPLCFPSHEKRGKLISATCYRPGRFSVSQENASKLNTYTTGDIRNPPCKRCREKDLTCYSQEGGNACVSCAKIKIRCSTKAVVKREKKPSVVNNARPETSKHISQSPPSRPAPIPRPLTRRPSWPIPVPRTQVYKTDDLLLSSSPAASPERNVERPGLRPVLQLAQERRTHTRSKVDEVKRYTTEEKGKGK